MSNLYDINCASARHLEGLADIPRDLAKRIVLYKKKRKRFRHIDELWRIKGMSRKYFANLKKGFYVPDQIVPRIGEKLPYINTLSTVTVNKKQDVKASTSKGKHKRKRKRMKKLSGKEQRLKAYNKVAAEMNKKKKGRRARHNKVQSSSDSSTGKNDFTNFNNLMSSHKAYRISRWVESIPKFDSRKQQSGTKSVHFPNTQNGYRCIYRKSEKQRSANLNVKKLSKVFFEEYGPENKRPIDLYQSCTIL